ncbi:acyl carrier protein [Streptomyces sp. GC420]|uniref:acyl carrier protein n=1 Tax=Streptomyces sp. GC420 TaxID=2697568 RepID=UPI001414D40F|nr:acyl carrier protein [Streptomyces sp. GC420]NBM20282.1 acyl carrier protein [Streptomyces sp. GC420]
MNRTEALNAVKGAIAEVVPGTDFTDVGPDDKFREVLELDSLDFLSFVEILGERTGVRIDEDDYPRLTTLSDSAGLLASRME